MSALRSLSEETAYRAIRGALRSNWPSADDRDVRRLAYAIRHQCGTRADRVAIALNVIEAARRGVDAGHWPGAGDVRVCADLLLASLDLALADVTAVEISMVLKLLANGYAPAVGIETGPGGLPV